MYGTGPTAVLQYFKSEIPSYCTPESLRHTSSWIRISITVAEVHQHTERSKGKVHCVENDSPVSNVSAGYMRPPRRM